MANDKRTTGRREAGRTDASGQEERRKRPRTAVELGALIRRKREDYDLPMAKLARQIGWERQRLANLESGKAVSADVRAWVLLADRLGFARSYLLGLAWEAAKVPFPVKLPPAGDVRRDTLIELAIEQHAADLPELP